MQFVLGFASGVVFFTSLTLIFREAFDRMLGRAAGMKVIVEFAPLDPKSTIGLTGGQTFNVKQDFRDQDPDKIERAFKDGIEKAIARKIGTDHSVFGE